MGFTLKYLLIHRVNFVEIHNKLALNFKLNQEIQLKAIKLIIIPSLKFPFFLT